MASKVIAARRGPGVGAVLGALLLAIVLAVMAMQASSIWSSTRHAQPVPAASNATSGWGPHGHIPDGCRVKIGCDQAFQGLGKGRHIPTGCRVKFGCQPDAGRGERH